MWLPLEICRLQLLSVQFSHSVMSDSFRPHESRHARPHCPSPTPGVHSDSRPLSQWYHPAISSSVVPFSSCPQSLPASEAFPISQLFAWSGQSTGVSALASFLPKNSQGWSPSDWTGWISLQSRGLSRVFSNTTVQKHQFFGAQPSSQSNSHTYFHVFQHPTKGLELLGSKNPKYQLMFVNSNKHLGCLLLSVTCHFFSFSAEMSVVCIQFCCDPWNKKQEKDINKN